MWLNLHGGLGLHKGQSYKGIIGWSFSYNSFVKFHDQTNLGHKMTMLYSQSLFVALCPKSTAMVMAGLSVQLTTLFPEVLVNKQLTSTSTSCTYFRL